MLFHIKASTTTLLLLFSFSNGRPKGADQDTVAEMSMQEPRVERTFDPRDMVSRAISELLKKLPIRGGDVEEVMHGGHHVHGEGHQDVNQAVGVGGVDMKNLMDDSDKSAKKKEEETAPSTLDLEQMMHFGDGNHGHNPHTNHGSAKDHLEKVVETPTANNPEDFLHVHDEELLEARRKGQAPSADNPEEASHRMFNQLPGKEASAQEESQKEKRNIGLNVEEVVHGDGHAHDHDEEVMEEFVDENGVKQKRKLGKQITFDDIRGLGLSDQDLEGIDLSKLLRRDQKEYEAWRREQEAKKPKSFWEKVEEFRKTYFNRLGEKIHDLSSDAPMEGGEQLNYDL